MLRLFTFPHVDWWPTFFAQLSRVFTLLAHFKIQVKEYSLLQKPKVHTGDWPQHFLEEDSPFWGLTSLKNNWITLTLRMLHNSLGTHAREFLLLNPVTRFLSILQQAWGLHGILKFLTDTRHKISTEGNFNPYLVIRN